MYRTDLAIERKEFLDEEAGKEASIEGVEMTKIDYGDGTFATVIDITSSSGAAVMEKPIGRYITIETRGLLDEDERIKSNAIEAVTSELKKLIKFHYKLKVLIVGLGNSEITPDSLGPAAVSKIRVTRHLFLMFNADGDDEMSCVSSIIPGVTGSTGIETASLIKKAVEVTEPELVIVIDSLAARNIDRVNTTIQITDTGITPGAGMGNERMGINQETIGTKVVAIGIPTVIDVTTIIREVLSDNLDAYKAKNVQQIEKYINEYKQQMIVTSTDIDMIIKEFSDIIAAAVNKCLHPGIYK